MLNSETDAAADVVTHDVIDIALRPDEWWWGGAVDDGVRMPFGDEVYRRDLSSTPLSASGLHAPSNQAAPLLVSTRGRAIGSGSPFAFAFEGGRLTVTGRDLRIRDTSGSLRDAYLAAAQEFFAPPTGTPAIELLTQPQYNTWIDQPYRPTQDSVVAYARGILDAGLPPGCLFIDDSWSPDYGTWVFDDARFPNARAMVDELHAMGFSVMLWLVPFVSPDSPAFRVLDAQGLLIRCSGGEVALRQWWNGWSAVLDLSNPIAMAWLTDQLDALVRDYRIDGFKFDGGDVRDFREGDRLAHPLTPVEMCGRWAELGLRYPFNEFRACWAMGGQPLGQRLQDKPPSWGPTGMQSLIPEVTAQSMIGHAFTCPDMIGGGEIEAMAGVREYDQEFFVRYAQLSALMPMLQFSASPAVVLDDTHLAAVKRALATRERFMPVIVRLARAAGECAEPLVRPMAYHSPALARVADQFYLGPDVVVAPVVAAGARSRVVALPEGVWSTLDGRDVIGPAMVDVACELDSLPVYVRRDSEAWDDIRVT